MDPADEYDDRAKDFLAMFRRFADWGFGDRCPDYDDGCYTCKMWSLYDQVEKVVTCEEPCGPGVHKDN